jgi:hypothetical protein
VLRARLPTLAARVLEELEGGGSASPGLYAAQQAIIALREEGYTGLPTWRAVYEGERPPEPADADPGEWAHGWQYYASSERETYFKDHVVMPNRTLSDQALIRSQSGPQAGRALTALPTGNETTLSPIRMNVLLRRRLRPPLPLGPRRCNGNSCRRELDALGDHWAACPLSGRLKRRAMPVEKMWARVLTEGGARVLMNQKLANMGLPGVTSADNREVEIVATNLPMRHGIPLACDATVCSSLHANGEARPRAAKETASTQSTRRSSTHRDAS